MNLINEIFRITGMIIIGGATLYVLVIFLGYIGTEIINAIGRWFKTSWIIVDWRLHKKEFKQWLKENVHPTNKRTK